MSKLGAPKREFCKKGHVMGITRKTHPNGDTYCSACKHERQVTYTKNKPELIAKYRRKYILKRIYGLLQKDYDGLLQKQDEKCAICKKDFETKTPHVDHCHTTGVVRGLLCHNCNTAIGLVKDNVEVLYSAIEYLGKTGKSKKKGSK